MKRRLTPKQLAFVDEYAKDRNATRAYMRAGYSPNGAQQSSSRSLRNAVVRVEIDKRAAEHSRVSRIEAVDALNALKAVAFADIGSYYDEAGNLLDPTEWTKDQREAVAHVAMREGNANPHGIRATKVTKVVLHNKVKALAQLLDVLCVLDADAKAR
jgi:phage terminase small subunit